MLCRLEKDGFRLNNNSDIIALEGVVFGNQVSAEKLTKVNPLTLLSFYRS